MLRVCAFMMFVRPRSGWEDHWSRREHRRSHRPGEKGRVPSWHERTYSLLAHIMKCNIPVQCLQCVHAHLQSTLSCEISLEVIDLLSWETDIYNAYVKALHNIYLCSVLNFFDVGVYALQPPILSYYRLIWIIFCYDHLVYRHFFG